MQGSDRIRFIGRGVVRKYWAADYALLGREAPPFAIVRTGPNKVMYGGASAMWEALMGTWGGGYWDDGSFIGVGNNGTPPDQTDNALHGMSQLLKGMDATYPQHTDGFVDDALETQFQSTFESADANFHWREWGVFNSSQSRMLQRMSEDLGLKTSDMVWEFRVILRLDC